jgi:hypothetical protein
VVPCDTFSENGGAGKSNETGSAMAIMECGAIAPVRAVRGPVVSSSTAVSAVIMVEAMQIFALGLVGTKDP